MDRLKAMGLVCELAAKFVEGVPKPIPKGWADAMSTVADMAEELAKLGKDPISDKEPSRLEAVEAGALLTKHVAYGGNSTWTFNEPTREQYLGVSKVLWAMAYEAAEADADPKKRVALANEVLHENKLVTIEPLLVLSSAHVTEATAKRLAADDITTVSVRPFGDDGWLVYVPTDKSIWADLEAGVEEDEVPQELLTVLKFAHELKCVWVLLDNAALEVSGLQSFDW